MRPHACGDQGFASVLILSAITRELALDDLLSAMLAPLVLSSQELLIKTLTFSHLAWFMLRDISTIKDSRVLVWMFKKLERAVNSSIGSVLWSSALVHDMVIIASEAVLERRSTCFRVWCLVGMGIGIVFLQWLTLALGVFAEEVLLQLEVLN